MLLTAGLLLQYFNSFFSCKPIFHTLSRKAAATTDCCYWIEAKGRAESSQLPGRTCAGVLAAGGAGFAKQRLFLKS